MHTHNLLLPPRLVASGGPVTRAIAACREDAIEAERARLCALRDAILHRVAADFDLLDRVQRAALRLRGTAA